MLLRFVKLFLFVLASVQLHAASNKNLPIPRFVSLRSSEVNARVGPGREYPTEWVFHREKLPVEIIAEFDVWRKIRDHEGSEGWVHQSMLSGQRMVINNYELQRLFNDANLHAKVIALVEVGVQGRLIQAIGDWCKVEINGQKGWLPRRALWGIYPHETIK